MGSTQGRVVIAVACAMVFDAIFGEPRWLWSRAPHPAVLMGRCVAWADRVFNVNTYWSGVLALGVLVTIMGVLGLGLAALPGLWAEALVGAMLLAQRSLVQHVNAVADALRLSTGDGRRSVAMIVGRDVSQMDEPAIARAAIESAAENFSDGVIAPLFWFILAGLPGLLIYKMVNTADSMIGYRTPRYTRFGWAAARFDDVLNWIPARLTALLLRTVASNRAPWPQIKQDAALHRSPNAGWPEAAMAPALDVALSGPRSYDGHRQTFAWVNPTGRKDAGANDIDSSITILWRAWTVTLALVVVVALW